MNIKELLTNEKTKKIIAIALLVIIALLSIFVFSKIVTDEKIYVKTIQSIDDKKATVMGITATAATASTLLATIPGDATTPIANQIMNISAYLLIVVCVLVLEKSLLTVMGYLSFNILIPVACALFAGYILLHKQNLKVLATKFVVFALVLVTIIPFSIKISDLIYEVNESTVTQLTTSAEENTEESQENQSWWDKFVKKFQDGLSDAEEKAKEILNKFIDAIAMFIIAYCAIPIVVVFVVIWFIKFLFGINIPIPDVKKVPLLKKKSTEEKELLEV